MQQRERPSTVLLRSLSDRMLELPYEKKFLYYILQAFNVSLVQCPRDIFEHVRHYVVYNSSAASVPLAILPCFLAIRALFLVYTSHGWQNLKNNI